MSSVQSTTKTDTPTPPSEPSTVQPHFLAYSPAWIVLGIALMITVVATLFMKADLERDAEQKFTLECSSIRTNIIHRLHDQARILRSGAAFFDSSATVTREEWRIFIHSQDLGTQLPGIQGIGFSRLIPRDELSRHIREIRREGFPDYTVKPEGDRDVYSSIIYLEPFSGRNLRAFGYDMFSEPTRRGAMERARDTGYAALSGKVVLVQEDGTDVQSGTLMYTPVYRKNMPTASLEQRRSALYGWVYSPYRMNDLMQGILAGRLIEGGHNIHLEIFDGEQASAQRLLFESFFSESTHFLLEKKLVWQAPIDFNGKIWTLRINHTSGGILAPENSIIWFIMAGGVSISFLLFLLIQALYRARIKTQQQLADTSVTFEGEITDLNSRLKLATESARIGVWDWSLVEDRLTWDDTMYTLYGMQKGNFSNAYDSWHGALHPDDSERCTEENNQALRGENALDNEFRILWPDGEVHYIKANAVVLKDSTGNPLRMVGINYDITERKRSEQSLRMQTVQLELEIAERQRTEQSLRTQTLRLELEIIERQRTEESLADQQLQLERLNDTLETMVVEELQKNRDKDVLLLHQDKMSSIGRLAAGVAHEINNPTAFIASNLVTLKGYATALNEYVVLLRGIVKEAGNGEDQQAVEKATGELDIAFILEDISALISESSEGAERVKRIVNGLKDFARVDTNQNELMNLNDCIQSSCNIIRNEIKYIATLELHLGEIPLVYGSFHHISQVLVNLLTNAADSIQTHGSITVTTQVLDDHVVLCVKDTGHGMSEEVKKRVFDPFFTTKQVGQGTGLGLSISYGIIKDHGGDISVESCEGTGTNFTIRLPIKNNVEVLT